jgi:hypothetical protein
MHALFGPLVRVPHIVVRDPCRMNVIVHLDLSETPFLLPLSTRPQSVPALQPRAHCLSLPARLSLTASSCPRFIYVHSLLSSLRDMVITPFAPRHMIHDHSGFLVVLDRSVITYFEFTLRAYLRCPRCENSKPGHTSRTRRHRKQF